MRIRHFEMYTTISEEEYAAILKGYEDKYPQPGKELELAAPSLGNLDGSLDPLFINPPAGNYHLQPLSPAVNAGDNLSYLHSLSLYDFISERDLASHNRLWGTTIDLGPYENQPSEVAAEKPAFTDGLSAWTQPGRLYIRSEQSATVSIYTTAGRLAKKTLLPEATTTSHLLPPGIYFLTTGHGAAKKVVVP
jgi:hypothetical protein